MELGPIYSMNEVNADVLSELSRAAVCALLACARPVPVAAQSFTSESVAGKGLGVWGQAQVLATSPAHSLHACTFCLGVMQSLDVSRVYVISCVLYCAWTPGTSREMNRGDTVHKLMLSARRSR